MTKNKLLKLPAAREWVLFFVMLMVSAVMILPLVWALSASFQGAGDIFKTPFRWLPLVDFTNYAHVLSADGTDGGLTLAFISSLKTAVIYLFAHLFFCSLAGFVIAKYDFRFKPLVFTLIITTMMIPQQLTLLPTYEVVRGLGLLNTNLGIALPFFMSGFGIFFMVQTAKGVPDEILDAARIDGCGPFQLYYRIMLPLMRPGLIALGILAFTFIWGEFAWSRLVISSDSMRTLPLALVNMATKSNRSVNFPDLIAGAVCAIAPIYILYIFLQRYFTEGIIGSALKG